MKKAISNAVIVALLSTTCLAAQTMAQTPPKPPSLPGLPHSAQPHDRPALPPKPSTGQPDLVLNGLAVQVTNVPGNKRDWVGVFPQGAANTDYYDWVYVACDNKTCQNKTQPSGSSVTVHLSIPDNAGQTDIRLMSMDANGTFQPVTQIDPDFTAH